MYADTVTDSMRAAIGETERRRALQEAYNQEHGITPQSIVKQIDEVMSSVYERDYMTPAVARDGTEQLPDPGGARRAHRRAAGADARRRREPRFREGGGAPRRHQAPAQPRARAAVAGAGGR